MAGIAGEQISRLKHLVTKAEREAAEHSECEASENSLAEKIALANAEAKAIHVKVKGQSEPTYLPRF